MKINDIFEASGRSAPLYHATNIDIVQQIFSSNTLKGNTEHTQDILYPSIKNKKVSKDKLSGISLTRDKAYADQWADAILILDQEKLKHNYKLYPVNYYKGDDIEYSHHDREEHEEFVVGDIKNLSNYLIGVYFPARLEKDYTNWVWVKKNLELLPEAFAGWKAVIESPKYVGKPLQNMQKKKSVNERVLNIENGTLWRDKNYSIKAAKNMGGIDLKLYDRDEQIGYLIADLDEKDGYLNVASTLISKNYKGKGFGKLLYTTLLKSMDPSVKGIKSLLIARVNQDAIPKIYQSLGGYEKDGYAYIDRKINEDSTIPTVKLWHATYKPYIKSIMKHGLGGKISKINWEDSKPGTVYLAKDPMVALSYAETSDMVPEEYLDQIVMLAIDDRQLDQSKLQIDQNVLDNTGDTVEYLGIIPPSAIKPIYRNPVKENSVHTPNQKFNSEEVIYNASQFIATISLDKMSIKLFNLLRKPEKIQIGRIVLHKSNSGYAIIADMKISKSEQGHSLDKLLVLLALTHLPNNFYGLKNKADFNLQITAVYNELNAAEEDGWLYIDRNDSMIKSDIKRINEAANLYHAPSYLVAVNPRNFRLDKHAVKKALWDLIHGKINSSKEPLKVFGSEYGQWQIADGYHRMMRVILLGKKKIKISKLHDDRAKIYSDISDHNLWNWNINELLDKKELNDLITKLREGELYEHGRIIPGANTPIGITPEHTKLMAKRLGFNVSQDGRPPIMPTNGKINYTPQEDPSHSANDKKSMFTGADLTPLTNGKSKDIEE